jgi:hypothetical protein
MSKLYDKPGNIEHLNKAALDDSRRLLARLIPAISIVGGDELVLLNPRLSDWRNGSLSVNLRNGEWGHILLQARGRGVVQLIAYAHGLSETEAVQVVAEALGGEAPPLK